MRCPKPPVPIHGSVNRWGSVPAYESVKFDCGYGYELTGKTKWTCLPTGQWDSECVTCNRRG